MSYNLLKVIHIVSGSLFFSCVCWFSYAWWRHKLVNYAEPLIWVLLLPTGLLQLITGFAIISIKAYPPQQFWIIGSTIGFILQIMGWYLWLWLYNRYQLLLNTNLTHASNKRYQILLSTMSSCLLIALFIMIYWMTNLTE